MCRRLVYSLDLEVRKSIEYESKSGNSLFSRGGALNWYGLLACKLLLSKIRVVTRWVAVKGATHARVRIRVTKCADLKPPMASSSVLISTLKAHTARLH